MTIIACGSGGRLGISANGTSWTAKTPPFGSGTINDIATSGTLAMFCGLDTVTTGTWQTYVGPADLNGPWTLTPATVHGQSIAYSPSQNRWVVVGQDASNNAVSAASTNDGTSWTYGTFPLATSYQIRQVEWIEEWGRWLATGGFNGFGDPTGFVATSTDGVTWTAATLPAEAAYTYRKIGYSPSLHRAVIGCLAPGGLATGGVIYSDDGTTWHWVPVGTGGEVSGSTSSKYVHDIAWSPVQNQFGASIVSSGNYIFTTSPDGITWTERTVFFSEHVAWHVDRWFAAHENSAKYILACSLAAPTSSSDFPAVSTANFTSNLVGGLYTSAAAAPPPAAPTPYGWGVLLG